MQVFTSFQYIRERGDVMLYTVIKNNLPDIN